MIKEEDLTEEELRELASIKLAEQDAIRTVMEMQMSAMQEQHAHALQEAQHIAAMLMDPESTLSEEERVALQARKEELLPVVLRWNVKREVERRFKEDLISHKLDVNENAAHVRDIADRKRQQEEEEFRTRVFSSKRAGALDSLAADEKWLISAKEKMMLKSRFEKERSQQDVDRRTERKEVAAELEQLQQDIENEELNPFTRLQAAERIPDLAQRLQDIDEESEVIRQKRIVEDESTKLNMHEERVYRGYEAQRRERMKKKRDDLKKKVRVQQLQGASLAGSSGFYPEADARSEVSDVESLSGSLYGSSAVSTVSLSRRQFSVSAGPTTARRVARTAVEGSNEDERSEEWLKPQFATVLSDFSKDSHRYFLRVFRFYAWFGQGHDVRGEPMILSAQFAKLCSEVQIIDGKNVDSTEVDLIFRKILPLSERKMNFTYWIVALRALAEKRWPTVGLQQRLTELEGLITKGAEKLPEMEYQKIQAPQSLFKLKRAVSYVIKNPPRATEGGESKNDPNTAESSPGVSQTVSDENLMEKQSNETTPPPSLHAPIIPHLIPPDDRRWQGLPHALRCELILGEDLFEMNVSGPVDIDMETPITLQAQVASHPALKKSLAALFGDGSVHLNTSTTTDSRAFSAKSEAGVVQRERVPGSVVWAPNRRTLAKPQPRSRHRSALSLPLPPPIGGTAGQIVAEAMANIAAAEAAAHGNDGHKVWLCFLILFVHNSSDTAGVNVMMAHARSIKERYYAPDVPDAGEALYDCFNWLIRHTALYQIFRAHCDPFCRKALKPFLSTPNDKLIKQAAMQAQIREPPPKQSTRRSRSSTATTGRSASANGPRPSRWISELEATSDEADDEQTAKPSQQLPTFDGLWGVHARQFFSPQAWGATSTEDHARHEDRAAMQHLDDARRRLDLDADFGGYEDVNDNRILLGNSMQSQAHHPMQRNTQGMEYIEEQFFESSAANDDVAGVFLMQHNYPNANMNTKSQHPSIMLPGVGFGVVGDSHAVMQGAGPAWGQPFASRVLTDQFPNRQHPTMKRGVALLPAAFPPQRAISSAGVSQRKTSLGAGGPSPLKRRPNTADNPMIATQSNRVRRRVEGAASYAPRTTQLTQFDASTPLLVRAPPVMGDANIFHQSYQNNGVFNAQHFPAPPRLPNWSAMGMANAGVSDEISAPLVNMWAQPQQMTHAHNHFIQVSQANHSMARETLSQMPSSFPQNQTIYTTQQPRGGAIVGPPGLPRRRRKLQPALQSMQYATHLQGLETAIL